MELTREQDRALQAVDQWYREPGSPQVFYLAGEFGTGKTTLARRFSEGISGVVNYGAYSGKAAYVMAQKGCVGATTIHSLIYRPKQKSKLNLLHLEEELEKLEAKHEGREPSEELLNLRKKVEAEREDAARPAFSLVEESPLRGAALTIIDECSMVDERMGADLLSFGSKVLVLGDPFQLPPIFGGGFFTDRRPDFRLTELHRQALDNPIVRMARMARDGVKLEVGQYGESRVVRAADLDPHQVIKADQLLVGKNKTRRATNKRVRGLLGREQTFPVAGDKLVCLHNNHELGLLNGSIWWAQDDAFNPGENEPDLVLRVRADGEECSQEVQAHKAHFEGFDPAFWERREFEEFDYAYALTVHKSQGSQWDEGYVFDEWFDPATRRQWLYTALSRFAKRVTVVKL